MRLVLDSSSAKVKVGLYDLASDAFLDVLEWEEERPQQSKLIFKLTDEILRKNSKTPIEVDSVAIHSGPGSYTGLRVGMSVAKTWCFARHLPLFSFCLAKEDSLRSLKKSEFTQIENIVDLEPLYENDHFGDKRGSAN